MSRKKPFLSLLQTFNWLTGLKLALPYVPRKLELQILWKHISYSFIHHLLSEVILPLSKTKKITLKDWCAEHLELHVTRDICNTLKLTLKVQGRWESITLSGKTKIFLFRRNGINYVRRRMWEILHSNRFSRTVKNQVSFITWICMTVKGVGRIWVI